MINLSACAVPVYLTYMSIEHDMYNVESLEEASWGMNISLYAVTLFEPTGAGHPW